MVTMGAIYAAALCHRRLVPEKLHGIKYRFFYFDDTSRL